MNPTKTQVEQAISWMGSLRDPGIPYENSWTGHVLTCLRALPQIIAERDRALKALGLACGIRGADGWDDCPLTEWRECQFPDQWVGPSAAELDADNADCPHEEDSGPCWARRYLDLAQAEAQEENHE